MADARAQSPELDVTRSWQLDAAPAPHDDESLADYLRRIGFTQAQLHYVRRAFANASGDSPERISAAAARDEWTDREAGDGDFRIAEGYHRIIEHLALGLDIRLTTVVRRVCWSAREIQVETAHGETFMGDAVIITLPLGVLQSGTLAFEPALSADKQAAIDALRMGPGMKIVFWFEQVVLPEGVTALYSALNPPMIWSPSTGRGTTGQIITCFATGDYARTLNALGEAQAIEAALQTLRTELGRKDLVPAAAQWINWTADPYSLGVYSTVPPGAQDARLALALPTPPLFWAGEATVRNAWGSTVHGALVSGRRAAAEVRKFLAHTTDES